MPIGELEQMVLSRAAALKDLAERGAPGMGGGAPAPQGGENLPPQLIQAASAALVQMGLLQAPTSTMTPEFIAALQGLVDKEAPGLYNLSDPEDIMEVLSGLASGTIGQPAGIGSGGYR